ncbi:putative enhancer of rudimentary [Paratrimastix pyriformis]|uniref:Enhancer of rudimentary n=1 Tax=Paratrimastix pyriformis TaxID=342808 RepID=A0ABQ8URT9_9EUKA|nr:putative enhancer of rudimentary [Paratrimastix pyriformis]
MEASSANSRAPKHTLMFIQFNELRRTRTYMHFESVSDALDGLCQLYEEKLQQGSPEMVAQQTAQPRTLDALFRYVDGFQDMGVLVYTPAIDGYRPYNREWVKEKLYEHLRRAGRVYA